MISTKTGCYLGKRFGKTCSASSTVVLQLPCCPGKQGKLLKKLSTKPLTQVTARPSSVLREFVAKPQRAVYEPRLRFRRKSPWWLESTQNPPPRTYFGKSLVKFFKKPIKKSGFLEAWKNASRTITFLYLTVQKNVYSNNSRYISG